MHTGIKNCGMQTASAIDAAYESGADYIGFIHYPASRRHLSFEGAASLSLGAPASLLRVAVLVNPSDDDIRAICDLGYAHYLQLHGDESPQRVSEVKSLSGLPIIKAVGIAQSSDVLALAPFDAVADMLLLDAKSHHYGGMGEVFDWSLLQGLQLRKPWFLSGGLTAQNVVDALRETNAPMVDVSSGIEREAGVKDESMIEQFNAAVRSYDAS